MRSLTEVHCATEMKFSSTAMTEIIHQTLQIVRMGRRSSCSETSSGALLGVFP